MKVWKFRSAFGYDSDAASDEVALICPEPTLATQSDRDEVDINTIVKRFGLTGQLPENVRAPVYADFHEVYDYHTAMNQIKAAEGAFMALPAHVRSRFENDPQQFVEFCSDEKNRNEAEQLGLVFPRTPSSVDVVSGSMVNPDPSKGTGHAEPKENP